MTSTLGLETPTCKCRDSFIAGRRKNMRKLLEARKSMTSSKIHMAVRQVHFKEFRFILMTVGKQ